MANLAEEKMSVVPMEWVGYRKSAESGVIFAQVGYAILAVDDSDEDVPTEYKIFTKEEDYEGKVVKSLDLFKLKKPQNKWVASGGVSTPSTKEGDNERKCFVTVCGASTSSAKEKWTPTPNINEGLRYLKQAEKDYGVADFLQLHAQEAGFYNMVCFLSQQVAEKSLRGLILALVGKDNRVKGHSWHNLKLNSCKVR